LIVGGMKRLVAVGLCSLALTLAASFAVAAQELPLRKPGLWELKIARNGSGLAELTMQHCTDVATDREMNNTVSPLAKQVCSKQEVQKTATGWVANSVCSVGAGAVTSHSEVTGDFNSAYTIITASHSDKGFANLQDLTTKVEGKWLGACKPDQKPGDVIMPGGLKLNVKTAEKLKGLLPSQ
jgi:hypothetical protein